MNQRLDVTKEELGAFTLPPLIIQGAAFQSGQTYPDKIDYNRHPAYASLIASATYQQKFKSLVIFLRYCFIVLIKRTISYEQIPARLRKPKTIADFGHLLIRSIQHITRLIIPKHNIPMSVKSKQAFNALQKQGVCVVQPSTDAFQTVANLAKPIFEQLRLKRSYRCEGNRSFSESRTTALRTTNEPLFLSVMALLSENGIIDAVSNYIGRPAEIIDINPQLNDCSDNFWQHVFPDLTFEKPATHYCHRDASGGDIKAIIYLTDVKIDNGPFSFILGSHRTRPNLIMNFIQEVNDSCGFSSTDLISRTHFSALPACLRVKCAFGNDLLSNSVDARAILAAEWQITESQGHVVIFDPKGIHRGGMVLYKERAVITCVLA